MVVRDLAREVADILDIPKNDRNQTARKIVMAIIKAMKARLLKGEEVTIGGFGSFQIFERKSPPEVVFFYNHDGVCKSVSRYRRESKPIRYVRFVPSSNLKRFVNES